MTLFKLLWLLNGAFRAGQVSAGPEPGVRPARGPVPVATGGAAVVAALQWGSLMLSFPLS